MQWPDTYLQILAEERRRELLASSAPSFDRPARRAHRVAPARGWRRGLWLAGHALQGLGQRMEELAAVHGRA